jgi:hypothetical protein
VVAAHQRMPAVWTPTATRAVYRDSITAVLNVGGDPTHPARPLPGPAGRRRRPTPLACFIRWRRRRRRYGENGRPAQLTNTPAPQLTNTPAPQLTKTPAPPLGVGGAFAGEERELALGGGGWCFSGLTVHTRATCRRRQQWRWRRRWCRRRRHRRHHHHGGLDSCLGSADTEAGGGVGHDRRSGAEQVRPVVLTGISLCDVCSCHVLLRALRHRTDGRRGSRAPPWWPRAPRPPVRRGRTSCRRAARRRAPS